MKNLRLILAALPFLLLSACASTPRLVFDPAVRLDSFSTQVSFSLQGAERGMSGSGFLVYHRPDQMRLVVLSPFGSTLVEVYVRGQHLALVYPAQSVAFLGSFTDLPATGELHSLVLLRWLLDSDRRPSVGASDGELVVDNPLGFRETLRFRDGVLESRESVNGDKVYFDKYNLINGVPFAGEIDLRDSHGDRLVLRFDEAEVNAPLDSTALSPRLDGFKLYPLSELQRLL